MSSNSKGKGGEREIARIYREHGFDAVRTPLSGGMRWKGDLIGVPGVHVEVKRCERAQIWDWIKQAEKDCERGDIPAVHFRRNRSDWYVSVPLEAFIELLKKRDES